MSEELNPLDSWKKEYYPLEPSQLIKAEDVTNVVDDGIARTEAIEHSLIKWSGLLDIARFNTESLKLEISSGELYQTTDDLLLNQTHDDWLTFDSESCALCHYDELAQVYKIDLDAKYVSSDQCDNCPIKQLTGRKCTEQFTYFVEKGGNPLPMIALLRYVKHLNENKLNVSKYKHLME